MLKARKGNREYTISDTESKSYNAQGFEIVQIEEDGEETVLMHNPGKKVPFSDYEDLQKEIEELREGKDLDRFSYDEMKVIAKKMGLEFAGNISKENVITLIKENSQKE